MKICLVLVACLLLVAFIEAYPSPKSASELVDNNSLLGGGGEETGNDLNSAFNEEEFDTKPEPESSKGKGKGGKGKGGKGKRGKGKGEKVKGGKGKGEGGKWKGKPGKGGESTDAVTPKK